MFFCSFDQLNCPHLKVAFNRIVIKCQCYIHFCYYHYNYLWFSQASPDTQKYWLHQQILRIMKRDCPRWLSFRTFFAQTWFPEMRCDILMFLQLHKYIAHTLEKCVIIPKSNIKFKLYKTMALMLSFRFWYCSNEQNNKVIT